MSICINNDLIWISVPRCASMSIENSIMSNPNIKYQHIRDIDPNLKNIKTKHLHINVDNLMLYFGKLDTVCIKRDWFERWISSLEYIWQSIEINNLTPRYNFEEIDNNFIYNMFTEKFVNKLQILDDNYDNLKDLFTYFILESKNYLTNNDIVYTGLRTLCSQKFWTSNEKCTYEFDIKELDKFEKFMNDRYNINFKIKHINKSRKLNNNLILNDDLKNFVWNRFESNYMKKIKLI